MPKVGVVIRSGSIFAVLVVALECRKSAAQRYRHNNVCEYKSIDVRSHVRIEDDRMAEP